MVYLRIDTNRNNTVLEISGQEYVDLAGHEVQFTTTYDFPTSQPPYFYRVTFDTFEVLPNDEDVIKSFNPEALSGLDMTPHIESVLNADFQPLGNKIVTIEGINFTPFSTVEISGEGNFVNTVYFDSPKKLRADITVGNVEDKFNLVVYNNDLQSDNSGFDTVNVKAKTTVDLRTIDPDLLGLELTSGVEYEQDSNFGMRFYSSTNSWNRGVKFGAYTWNRSNVVTFEMVFTRVSSVLFMVGIASASLNVNSISTAYYKQEIGMFHNNNSTTTFYGGGDVTNWSQNIGQTIGFDANKFYKLKFENSGGQKSLCLLCEVNPNDWDDETLLHSWISDCPADDEILTPFLLPQASSGVYYITGFRY
jgi:hypothetical protein